MSKSENRKVEKATNESQPQKQGKRNIDLDLSRDKLDFTKLAEKCMWDYMPIRKDGEKGPESCVYAKNLTVTQMRNMWGRVTAIYNQVRLQPSADKLSGEIQQQLRAFKIRLVYESARTPDVGEFCQTSSVLSALDQIGEDKDKFFRYVRYFEALVAYHYYYTKNRKD